MTRRDITATRNRILNIILAGYFILTLKLLFCPAKRVQYLFKRVCYFVIWYTSFRTICWFPACIFSK